MGRSAKKTTTQTLESITKNKKKTIFVKWYVNNMEHTEEQFNKDIKNLVQCEFDTAMNYLLEEEVQQAIKKYMQQQQLEKIINIFNIQYKNAIDGDIKSAEFILKFYDNPFFKEVEQTEMEVECEDILSKIKIPLFDKE